MSDFDFNKEKDQALVAIARELDSWPGIHWHATADHRYTIEGKAYQGVACLLFSQPYSPDIWHPVKLSILSVKVREPQLSTQAKVGPIVYRTGKRGLNVTKIVDRMIACASSHAKAVTKRDILSTKLEENRATLAQILDGVPEDIAKMFKATPLGFTISGELSADEILDFSAQLNLDRHGD